MLQPTKECQGRTVYHLDITRISQEDISEVTMIQKGHKEQYYKIEYQRNESGK